LSFSENILEDLSKQGAFRVGVAIFKLN